MIKVLCEILYRENINGCCKAKNLLNLRWSQRSLKSLKYFTSGNVHFQDDPGNRYDGQLPTMLYIQNPITWLLNKIDFKVLQIAWDAEFDEEEFKRGSKQAMAVICTYISKNLWDNLRGLVTQQTLSSLQREVEVKWSDEQRRHIDLESKDIKLTLPNKVHFLRIADQKFVDIDMNYIAVKYKQIASTDLVFIELGARFHRNYTVGELPNWTVTLFKVIRFSVIPGT